MAIILAFLAFGGLGYLVVWAYEAQQTDHALLVATKQFTEPQPVIRPAQNAAAKSVEVLK